MARASSPEEMPTAEEREARSSAGERATEWGARLTRAVEFRPREVLALVAVGAAVLVVAVVAFLRARPVPLASTAEPVAMPTASASAPAARAIFVHVAGAVRRPGVYEFAEGARVIDALKAAGGATRGADVNAINLARPLADGEQVLVPKRGEAPPGGGASGASAPGEASGSVNLNTADAGALEALPGIGPVLAQRIVDYRTQHGPFRSVRDLLKIEGIGDKKFASIEPHVTV